MATLVIDPQLEEQLLEQRRASRGDRFDEVWDGVYVMSPLANNEHQELLIKLAAALHSAFASQPDVRVFPGVNVSDREDDWEKNYRCPDVAVVLPDSRAIDRGAYYLGGPDFVVEIASDYDRSREKFDFYASVGVRELLIVDRNPWQLELYRLEESRFVPAGASEPTQGNVLTSHALNLTFKLLPATAPRRPQVEIVRPSTGDRWLA